MAKEKDLKDLKDLYDGACNLYAVKFMKKHGLWDDEFGSTVEWIDKVHGMLMIADMYIPMDDIRFDIDNEIQKGIYIDYYYYVVDNEKRINYKSYLMGAR